jgi:hypothetical protein
MVIVYLQLEPCIFLSIDFHPSRGDRAVVSAAPSSPCSRRPNPRAAPLRNRATGRTSFDAGSRGVSHDAGPPQDGRVMEAGGSTSMQMSAWTESIENRQG